MEREGIPELLAPAGSYEALKAAVSAGADAVYLGGRKFGARNLASNFNGEELKEAVEYCHSRNVRVYVTHNTLIHDDEIPGSLDELCFLFTIGVDAVLIQDFGILSAAKKCLPDLTLHASTQMTIHSPEGVIWAAEKGISRVVLAREMSPGDIAAIKAFPGAEDTGLEVFVHGALCCSYSGQCLLSSMIGGRSGNRGLCAQPCRREYSVRVNDGRGMWKSPAGGNTRACYIMSPGDLCTYRNLKKLVSLGVDSLKIEGRMKSPEYVAIVVSVYRKALDRIARGGWSPSDDDETLLMLAFNRGFTGGYISGESGAAIMSVDFPGNRGVYAGTAVRYDRAKKTVDMKTDGPAIPSPGDGILFRQKGRGEDFGMTIPGNAKTSGDGITFHVKMPVSPGSRMYITRSMSLSGIAKEITSSPGGIPEKIPVGITIRFNEGIPIATAVFPSLHGEQTVEKIAGFAMETARSRPVGTEDLKNIFCKTGNLQFDVERYDSDYEGGLFAPLSLLNEFRRDLFSGIEKRLVDVCLPSEEKRAEASCSIEKFISSINPAEGAVLPKATDPVLSAYVSERDSVEAALKGGCKRIYFEMDPACDGIACAAGIKEGISAAKRYGAVFIWKWPRITDNSFIANAESAIDLLGDDLPDGIMVENAGDGITARRIAGDIPLYGGQGLNIFNHPAVGAFSGEYDLLTLSCELNREEINRLCSFARVNPHPLLEYPVNGPAEILISENNLLPVSDGGECAHEKNFGLADTTGRIFPLRVDGRGRTHVYNSAVTCLIDSLPDLFSAGIDGISLDLRLYPPDIAEKTADIYRRGIELFRSHEKKRSGAYNSLKKEISDLYKCEITAGHFRRGV